MKNIFYILILTLTISGCEEFEEDRKQVYSNDYKNLEIKNNFEVIDLDTIENFAQLRTQMGRLACQNKIPGLKFSLQKTGYYLTGFAECPSYNEVSCYFGRNSIIIKNDSIVKNISKKEKIPIEDLETELNEIISKSYNFQYNKEIMKPALILLYINEKQNISTTKKVLKQIVEQFGKLNSSMNSDFFEYNILFESFDRSNLPPPPPPPPMPEETGKEQT